MNICTAQSSSHGTHSAPQAGPANAILPIDRILLLEFSFCSHGESNIEIDFLSDRAVQKKPSGHLCQFELNGLRIYTDNEA
jgi:hypothetical protein